MTSGWRSESERHSLSRQHIKTVYHGTNKNFNPSNFKTRTISANSLTPFGGEVEVQRNGIFVTENPEIAKQFGNRVYNLQVRMNNTAKITDDLIYQFTETLDPFKERDLWMQAKYNKHPWQLFDDQLGYRFVKFLKSKGYDSAEFDEEMSIEPHGKYIEGTTYVLFSKSQVAVK